MSGLLALLRPHRRQLAVVVLISLVGAGAALAQPLLVRRLLAAVTASGDRLPAAGPAGGGDARRGAAVGGLSATCCSAPPRAVVLTARRGLVDRLLRLRVAAVDQSEPGDLMSRVGADTTLLRRGHPGVAESAGSGAVTWSAPWC